jgi:hypothetical protein
MEKSADRIGAARMASIVDDDHKAAYYRAVILSGGQ